MRIGPAVPVMSQLPQDFSILLDYWRSKRSGRLMPRRADIDPTELPGRLWPHLMLIDVVREEERNRFRYRLLGGDVIRAFGRDPTGEYLDEATSPDAVYRGYIIEIPNDVVGHRRPLYTVNVLTLPGQTVPMTTRRLTLPLSNDGATVNMLLSAHIYEYPCGETRCLGTSILALEELVREYL
jgi:hypothetical protein